MEVVTYFVVTVTGAATGYVRGPTAIQRTGSNAAPLSQLVRESAVLLVDSQAGHLASLAWGLFMINAKIVMEVLEEET